MWICHTLLLFLLVCWSWRLNGAFLPSLSSNKKQTTTTPPTATRYPSALQMSMAGEQPQQPQQQQQQQQQPQQQQQQASGATNAAAKEAQELRQRARQLKAEANAMAVALSETRTDTTKRRNEESDALLEQLFDSNDNTTLSPLLLVERINTQRWSPEQLLSIVERIHERQMEALGRDAPGRRIMVPEDFQIGNVRNGEPDAREWMRLDQYLQTLLEASAILDEQFSTAPSNNDSDKNPRWTSGRVTTALRTRLKELQRANEQDFQRRLAAATVNAASSTSFSNSNNASKSVQDYTRKSLGLPTLLREEGGSNGNKRSFNISRVMESVAMVPMWIPSSLLPFLLRSEDAKLDPDDVKTIREQVLKSSSFYCTSSDSIPGAAIFRGNVRTPSLSVVDATTMMEGNQTAVLFQDVQQRLSSAGLSTKVQLFFWNDPEWRPGRDSRELAPKPVIIALPTAVVPEQSSETGKALVALKILSSAVTLLSTLAYSISCYALNPEFFSSVVNRQDLSVLAMCLPLFAGVLMIQSLHEVAHYFVAKKMGIKTGLPVPLPSFQVGTFGCITPLRSFPANRAALLDFALSGPLAGLAASIGLMVGGIFATIYASSTALARFPAVPVALLKASYFVGSLLSLLAPKIMLLPASQPIPVHPLFVIGFAGLITNALNLLPLGRLDGGRAYSAVFGSRNAVFATFCTMMLIALLSVTGTSSLAVIWGLMVFSVQRHPEIPVRNDVSEVDDVRVTIYLLSLTLAILTLAPFPGGQGML